MVNMMIIEKITLSGSLTIISRTDKNEFCTSLTSPDTLAIISPFRFSEKKLIGKLTVFL